jgi:hypothetical protein
MHGTLLYLVEMESASHTTEIRQELTREIHHGREVIDNPPSRAPIIYTSSRRSDHGRMVAWSNAAIRGWNFTSHTRGYVNIPNLEG